MVDRDYQNGERASSRNETGKVIESMYERKREREKGRERGERRVRENVF